MGITEATIMMQSIAESGASGEFFERGRKSRVLNGGPSPAVLENRESTDFLSPSFSFALFSLSTVAGAQSIHANIYPVMPLIALGTDAQKKD